MFIYYCVVQRYNYSIILIGLVIYDSGLISIALCTFSSRLTTLGIRLPGQHLRYLSPWVNLCELVSAICLVNGGSFNP